jgi:transcription elongation GreA/GreB family factor
LGDAGEVPKKGDDAEASMNKEIRLKFPIEIGKLRDRISQRKILENCQREHLVFFGQIVGLLI